MAIDTLHIGNFKGIKEDLDIKLKPITLFIGRNSSGKSSCIHALTALSQSVKMQNNSKPLILDDEYASIHLGRYIEVVHTKSYSDQINLGLEISNVKYNIFDKEGKRTARKGKGKACYSFKSTKRTQDISLHSATLSIDDFEYSISKKKNSKHYDIQLNDTEYKVQSMLINGFLFDQFAWNTRSDFNAYRKFAPLFGIQNEIQKELQSVYYLGPFRQSPLRRYPTRGASPIEVGAQGEYTATLLANETVQSRSRNHISQIAFWLSEMGLAKSIDVGRIGNSDLFDLNITLTDDANFPIADLGYGLSQILPVVTQCSFATERSTLLFEQPELHLHPKSARLLADIFVKTAIDKNCTLLIETHSIELLGRLQQLIRNNKISNESIAAYLVVRSDHKTKISEIDLDSEGGNYDVNWRKELEGDV